MGKARSERRHELPIDIERRTGLTRRRQRYCEAKGYLGEVGRSASGRRERIYTPDQVRFLESVAAFRASGVRLEEAAALATEEVAGIRHIDGDRLERLAARSLDDVETALRTALEMWRIIRKRMQEEDVA